MLELRASGSQRVPYRRMLLRRAGPATAPLVAMPDRYVVMRCLAATACPGLGRSPCPGLQPTEGYDCLLDGRPPQPCGAITASGGQGTTRTRHDLGTVAGKVRISYETFSAPDRLDCYYRGVLVASTGGLVSGNDVLQWAYDPPGAGQTWCLVVVSAPVGGTLWTYTVHCPS